MTGNTTVENHVCCNHKEGSVCSAVRALEERVRMLEDQSHAAFASKLKAPHR